MGHGPVTKVNLEGPQSPRRSEKPPPAGHPPFVLMPLSSQVEDLKSQLASKDDSQRLVEQEIKEKLREAQEYSQIQKELESEKAR